MISGYKMIYNKMCYDILGVREDACYEEIRTRYRSAILDSHPDKLQNTQDTSSFDKKEVQNRFLEVQRAWEILSNPESRRAYDEELRALKQEEDVVIAAAQDIGLEDVWVGCSGEVLELSHQCRCGDCFCIDSSELEEIGYRLIKDGTSVSLNMSNGGVPSSVLLPCSSCSLQVRLSFDTTIKLQIDEEFL